MDVLNVDPAVSDEEIENDDGIERLVEGLKVSDLSSTGTEFAVHVNEDDALEMQTCYEGPSVLPHLDLRCLGPEEDDSNSEMTYDCDSPFAFIALKMTDLVPNGKVKKRVISEGYGEVVPPKALVWFHYNSYFEGKDLPFDSSYLRGSKKMLRLNSGNCIYGLDIGLSTMKKSEKSEFLIHPDYAYGKLGVPPRIDPDEHVLIIVEMLNFVDNALAVKLGELTEEELKSTSFEEIYKGALNLLSNGKNEFSQKRYQAAVKMYRNALRLLENCDMNSDEDDRKNEELRCKLYSNLGVCYNKMYRSKQAIVQCQNALRIQPKNPKILYTLGQAHLNLSSYDEAKKYAFLARKYAPRNQEISELLLKIEQKMERYNSTMISFAKNAFKFDENNSKVGFNNKDSPENKIPAKNLHSEINCVNSPLESGNGVKIVELVDEKSEKADRQSGKGDLSQVNLLPAETTVEDFEREFQQEIISCIEDFLNNPNERKLAMPYGLTYEEEMFFKKQACLFGLRCEDREEEGRTVVYLLK